MGYPNLVIPFEEFFLQATRWAGRYSVYGKEMVIAILIFSAVLFAIRMKRNIDGNEPLEDGLHTANWIVFLASSILVSFYIIAFVGRDATWFCKPYLVGWLWTTINFILYALVVYNQLTSYLNTLRDVQYNSYASISWQWGLYSWPAALVAVLITSSLYQPGFIVVVILFLVVQLYQIGTIFTQVVPKGGWGHAILCTVVYLFGAVATIGLIIHFVVLLIVIAFILLIIWGVMLGASQKSKTKCPHCEKPVDECQCQQERRFRGI